ncbi:MAG: class I SAM-dependent methyltransferase [Candidatus Binatia bacterium]
MAMATIDLPPPRDAVSRRYDVQAGTLPWRVARATDQLRRPATLVRLLLRSLADLFRSRPRSPSEMFAGIELLGAGGLALEARPTVPVRSLGFGTREHDRYWWHKLPHSGFVPPLYAALTEAEWAILEAWYADTDENGMCGEAAVTALSVLQGFVTGSLLRSVVQLGCFAGYSTLLVGFMMRRLGLARSVLSIDNDPKHCSYTEAWVRLAGLADYVRLECSDSAAPHLPALAQDYFGRGIEMVFVDSSHQYAHTARELALWFPAVVPGGFVFLHDASDSAAAYDATGQGGVHRAFAEWRQAHPDQPAFSINECMRGLGDLPVYKDGCGLGIIQRLPRG